MKLPLNNYIYAGSGFLFCSSIFTQYILYVRGNNLTIRNSKKLNVMDAKISSIETKLNFLARKCN